MVSILSIIEHPDIAAAERDGYPSWAGQENRDSEEYRDEFIQENVGEFLNWMKAGDQDVLDRFFEEHKAAYRNFLN